MTSASGVRFAPNFKRIGREYEDRIHDSDRIELKISMDLVIADRSMRPDFQIDIFWASSIRSKSWLPVGRCRVSGVV